MGLDWTPTEFSALGAPVEKRGIRAHLIECISPKRLHELAAGLANRVVQRYSGDPAISIRKDPRGKPYLASPGLHVSISHSGSCLLVAVGFVNVGVDVEYLRFPESWQAVYHWISRPEDMVPEPDGETFLMNWTAKEALVKAMGYGLDYGMDRLPAPALIKGQFVHVAVDGRSYALMRLPAWKGFVSCIAVEHPCPVETLYLVDLPDPVPAFP